VGVVGLEGGAEPVGVLGGKLLDKPQQDRGGVAAGAEQAGHALGGVSLAGLDRPVGVGLASRVL
jgi:hypothetical protein